jgi:hypothetical protein
VVALVDIELPLEHQGVVHLPNPNWELTLVLLTRLLLAGAAQPTLTVQILFYQLSHPRVVVRVV